jgi:exopolysaccharide biosynthesis protein
LVSNGQYAVVEDRLDTKMRTTKASRTAIGILPDGNIIWAQSPAATIYDMAAIMQALEVNWAMNLDGGGSTALYYAGSYKLGPGRKVPNAIVFAESN